MLRPRNRSLSFESLEKKELLAGDVTVSLVGGNLRVRGDDAANQIVITSTADGTFNIRGLEGTTVKLAGSTTPAPESGLVVNKVRGVVNVNLAGGDDKVTVENAQFRLGLTIETGAGDDDVIVTGAKFGTFLNIFTGADDDSVQLGPATTPTAAAATADAASVKAGLAIDIALGDGVDTAVVNSASANGAIVVGGGLGADSIGLHNVRSASLVARGGDGDAVDQVDISQAKAIAAIIGTGDGADHVGIIDSAFTSLNVALGRGDDGLSLQKVKSKITVLAGGEGAADQFTDAGESTLGLKVITGFELPDGINTPRRPLTSPGGGLANLLARILR